MYKATDLEGWRCRKRSQVRGSRFQVEGRRNTIAPIRTWNKPFMKAEKIETMGERRFAKPSLVWDVMDQKENAGLWEFDRRFNI